MSSPEEEDAVSYDESTELQQPPEEEEEEMDLPVSDLPSGTILEAAFVDPAYSWPPRDGEGKNAIELQASLLLLKDIEPDDDLASMDTTESMKKRMRMPKKPRESKKVESVQYSSTTQKRWWWQCCRNNDAVESGEAMRVYYERKSLAKEARKAHAHEKRSKVRQKEKELRKKSRYTRVPEGILIYRLDTSTLELSLMSKPHTKTNLDELVTEMKVVKAKPSSDKSRRGMEFEGEDGTIATLVACEQRTATAWLEAASIMLAKNEKTNFLGGRVSLFLFDFQRWRVPRSFCVLTLYSFLSTVQQIRQQVDSRKAQGRGTHQH